MKFQYLMMNLICRYLDVVGTSYLLERGVPEGNPLLRRAMEVLGTGNALTLSFFWTSFLCIGIFFLPSKYGLTGLKFLLVCNLLILAIHGICWLAIFGLI